MEWYGIECDEMEWDRIGGIECNGMAFYAMECYGIECNSMEWSRMEWNGMFYN